MDHISAVPSRILTNIFKFLLVEDRKNVRLTCRRSYNECNCPDIMEEEKFVFRKRENRDCVQHYGAGLLSAVRGPLRTYFEFHGLPLMEFPPDVWRWCGDRIRFLFLYNCDIDGYTFAQIVFYCLNLVRFRFERNDLNDSSLSIRLFCDPYTTTPEIDRLVGRIVRQKLTSFEIYLATDEHGVSDIMYRKIFKIFPNIRTFGDRGWKRNPFRGPFRVRRYTLADGNVNSPSEWLFPPERVLQFWPWQRLKFKEFRCPLFVSDYLRNFFNFITYQTELENINLFVYGSDGEHISILLRVLQSLPKIKQLQYLGFRGSEAFLAAEDFDQFLELFCELESLLLAGDLFSLDDAVADAELLLPSVKYTRLKKLCLGHCVQEALIFAILNRCGTSLQFLRLDALITRRIVQKIFDRLTNLQSLQIYNIDDNRSWPTPVPCSYSRLQSLKRLEIKLFVSALNFSSFLSNFNSPNLRYFLFPKDICSIHSNHEEASQIFHDTIDMLSRKAPGLEILSFCEQIPFSAIELTNSCRQLMKLKIIYVSNFSMKQWVERDVDSVVNLFIECRSLRWLASDGSSLYSYDHSSGELIEYTDNICLFDRNNYNICGSGDVFYTFD